MVNARVATAAVLIPAVVSAVLLLDTPWFAAVSGFVVFVGAWEWAGIAGWGSRHGRIAYVALFAATALAIVLSGRGLPVSPMTVAASFAWFCAALWLAAYQSGRAGSGPQWLKSLVGLCVLLPFWMSLVDLHARGGGRGWVLFLLVMIWVADSAAFFGGRRFGRRRLASTISPGKTWEGVIAGLLGGAAAGATFGLYREMQGVEMLVFLVLCLGTVAASVVGDLLESMMKRSANLKDSGSLLPGHGGLLDRIDSLTAAAPVFLAGLMFMGGPA